MFRSPKVLLLVALLVISVATLVQTIMDADNRVVYGLATTVSHVALVVVGTTFARGVFVKKNSSDNSLS